MSKEIGYYLHRGNMTQLEAHDFQNNRQAFNKRLTLAELVRKVLADNQILRNRVSQLEHEVYNGVSHKAKAKETQPLRPLASNGTV